jgi:translation initiation factor IF-2
MLVKTEKGGNISTLKIIGDPNSQIQIPLIIKADSQGSYEALEFLIDKLGKNQQWCFNLIYSGIGDITESDLKIANPLGTLVIGFRVKKRPETIVLIKNNPSLVIIEEDIVYNIEQKIKEITEKRFIEKPKEQIIGQLEVLSVFNPSKGHQIIGGKVLEGEILLKSRFHLIRNEEIIGEGKVVNLQQNKMDVRTVKVNQECGLMVEYSKEIKAGDKLEFFQKIS